LSSSSSTCLMPFTCVPMRDVREEHESNACITARI
jgi:hypothetical protein